MQVLKNKLAGKVVVQFRRNGVLDSETVAKGGSITLSDEEFRSIVDYNASNWDVTSAADEVIDTAADVAAAVSSLPSTHTHTNGTVLDAVEEALTTADKANYDAAYGWGDHSGEGYLTAETDPVFLAHDAAAVTSTKMGEWDTAYGWGDHGTAGYAAKDSATAIVDAQASTVVSAPTQTASYVQADVQAIADLANDLKAKYDAAVSLINDLKAKLNTMNA